jgi:metal-responsive CopG/Arc/MetJ family transcriptional regulator
MDSLVGCKNVINEYGDSENSSDNSRQRPVNVGMSPKLVSRIDFFVDTSYIGHDNRSELIRQVLLEKLEEWEAEHRGEKQ